MLLVCLCLLEVKLTLCLSCSVLQLYWSMQCVAGQGQLTMDSLQTVTEEVITKYLSHIDTLPADGKRKVL